MPCKKQTVGFEEKVVEIAIERLREFRNHPFQIREDGQMKQLKESIGKYSTKVAETSAEGISIFRYAPRCKAAEGFIRLTEEVLKYE